MLARDAGGIKGPLRTPTRHLVLRFDTAGGDASDIGTTIATDHDVSLESGGRYAVQLTFWAPNAEAILAGRDKFGLWLGKVVGSGLLSTDSVSRTTTSPQPL